MNNITGLLFAAICLLAACKQPDQQAANTPVETATTTLPPDHSKIDSLLQSYAAPTQHFQASTRTLINIKGKQGSIIQINPAYLETVSGEPIGSSVDIALQEMMTQQQLLASNAPTVSDGRLLVSGGAIYINLTSNGQQVQMKKGKSYSLAFPKTSNEPMSVFYGERDATDNMNWKETNQQFVAVKPKIDSPEVYEAMLIMGEGPNSDTTRGIMQDMTQEEKKNMEKEQKEQIKRNQDYELRAGIYYPQPLTKFGWINCDRFYESSSPRTDIVCSVSNKQEDLRDVMIYLIFKDINSLMKVFVSRYEKESFSDTLKSIPVGTAVRFMAVGYPNGKIFATLTEEKKIGNNHQEILSLQEMSKIDFDSLMKQIK